jgi:hypothetical protein
MKTLITVLCMLILSSIVFAQAPSSFKYQAIARDTNGDVLENQNIQVRIGILQTSTSGTVVCEETFEIETNTFGLFNIEVGSINNVDFGNINWGEGPYFVKVEMNTGEGFVEMGTSQLLSVPYALYAEKSGNEEVDPIFTAWDKDYEDLINLPTIPTVPENVSEFNNDAGFISEYTETDPLFNDWDKDYNDLINIPNIPTVPEDLSEFNNDIGFITDYTETDPFFTNWDKDYSDLINTPTIPTVPENVSDFTNDAGYLTEFNETDPLWVLSPSYNITNSDITNWNTAYGWGDHSGLYRPVSWVPAWTNITGKPTTIAGYGITDAYTKSNMQTSGGAQLHFNNITNKPTTLAGYGITNAMSTSHAANGITGTNITNWNTAYGWGNHASANYLPKAGGTMTGNLAASDNTNISGFNAALASGTSTSYTLSASDNGKVITLSNAGAITLTVPTGLPTGFNCLIVQTGAGQVTFTASGTTIQNRQTYTKTAGQYAIATLVHLGSNVFVTSGDME